MQIVCGEFSLLKEPERFSEENEVVLEIRKIINHELYDPGQPGKERRGPYRGGDIAVYKVDGSKLALKKKELYPACLPRSSSEYEEQPGIFSGWVDPEPIHRVNKWKKLRNYIKNYLEPRDSQMEEVDCGDPSWMGSNSYYPPGTVCYRDPSLASCSIFGNSGSSVVRKIKTTDRYSWIGPLSMSKGKYQNIMNMNIIFVIFTGCDIAWNLGNSFTYAAENPSVFTDGYCYLDWIARQYGKSPPKSYIKPERCKVSKGDINDLDKDDCKASGVFSTNITKCNWGQRDEMGKPWDKCRLVAEEGFAYNVYHCKDPYGEVVTCANNCRGVDPNAIVIGGTAVLAATATAPTGLAVIALGLGGVGLVGAGAMANGMCPPTMCRVRTQFHHLNKLATYSSLQVRGRCCMFQNVRGMLRCPSRC